MYNKNGLTIETIERVAPSVFATQPYSDVSDRYSFIPTYKILEELLSKGFLCVGAEQSNVKIRDKYNFTAHNLRFRLPSDKVQWNVGDVFPEVLVNNSHDRSRTYRVLAGFWRLWCSNGCAAPIGNNSEIRTRHSGDVGEVIDATYQVVEDFPTIGDTIQRWQQTEINAEQQVAFANAAAQLRWDENKVPVSPITLLRRTREQDRSNDLFTTYQVVQEHLTKGGDRGVSTGRTRRRMRTQPIKNILEDTKINKALWTLTQKMEELVHA
jgi:hypothetical protein